MSHQPARHHTLLVLGNVTKDEYLTMARAMVRRNCVVKILVLPERCSLSHLFSSHARENPEVDAFASTVMKLFLDHNWFYQIGAVIKPAYFCESRYQPPWDLITGQIPPTVASYNVVHGNDGRHLRFDGKGLGDLKLNA